MSKAATNIPEKVGGTPLVEISGKLNKGGAKVLSKRPEFAGKTIVALQPDPGERYLSTWLFE